MQCSKWVVKCGVGTFRDGWARVAGCGACGPCGAGGAPAPCSGRSAGTRQCAARCSEVPTTNILILWMVSHLLLLYIYLDYLLISPVRNWPCFERRIDSTSGTTTSGVTFVCLIVANHLSVISYRLSWFMSAPSKCLACLRTVIEQIDR